MLGKLIKNELKAGARAMALIYTVALGSLTVFAISLALNILWLNAIATIAIMLVAGGILLATAIYIISSFYRTLFRDQGYLTFTLPVTSGQILAAKGICSFLWLVISFAALIGLNIAMFALVAGLARDQFGEDNIETAKLILGMFVELPNKATVIVSLASAVLYFFLKIVFAIALVFFCITLSNVRPFQRQGFLPAVLIFVVLFTVVEIISIPLRINVPISLSLTLPEGLRLENVATRDNPYNLGVADVLFQLACTVFFFGFSGWLMNHKINLK